MKKFLFIFLTVLILILVGCGVEPHDHTADDSIYHSDTATEDCYLCGNGAAKDGENLLYWGQDNIALLSLNIRIIPIARAMLQALCASSFQ